MAGANIKLSDRGHVQVHIAGGNLDFATLCGMDVYVDNVGTAGGIDVVDLGYTEEKVNCGQCVRIWAHCRNIKPSKINLETLE